MRCRILTHACLGLLCAITSTTAAEPSDADVFESVFKTRAASERVPVVLVIDGTDHGPIVLEVRSGTAVRVNAGAILGALAKSRLQVRTQERLAATVRDRALALDDLRAAKLDVVYDSRRLELRIGVPATSTERASHTLGSTAPAEVANAIGPSDRSGYLNVYARGGTASPNHLRFDSAVNIHRWVLEARGELGESPIGVHRGDVLLSRDVPGRALRFLVGDFAVAAGGMQPGYPMLGVGVTRNFTLQPYRVIQPVGVFHFTLERPANVTVLVNGAPVQTLELAAGRHDVRDLPLGAGVNDIELLVRDATGIERRLQFSAPSPNELLAPGVDQFSLSLGFPSSDGAGARSYAWSRPIVSGRQRWGVTDRLTVGGSLDGDFERQVIGGALAIATSFGNLAIDVAGSRDTDVHFGHAATIRYDYQRLAGGTATNTLTLAARHFSAGFRSLEVLDVDGHFRGDVSLASSRKLTDKLFARLQARYQLGRDVADSQDASLTLSRTFGGLSLDVLVGYRDSGTEPREARVFVTAHWRLPGRKGTVHALSRTSSATGASNELRYMTQVGPPPGGFVASGAVRQNRDTYGGDVTVGYSSDRFTSSVTGTTGIEHGAVATTASFDVGTAIAFAGGTLAWSRPITGSFAIVDRNETLSDQEVGINPIGSSYTSRADRFGPAVVPGLEPYRLGSVRVEAPDLRIGTSLGPASHHLVPAYKSGTAIVVGEPGTVFLRGSLRHPDGTPVALAVGELVPMHEPMNVHACDLVEPSGTSTLQQRVDCMSEYAGPSQAALVLQTNRAGRFSVVGVVPGRYTIKLATGTSIPIVIPKRHAGIFSVGILVAR